MLPRKGRLAAGSDADLVVLDGDGGVQDVMARGRWHVRGGRPLDPGNVRRRRRADGRTSRRRSWWRRTRGYIIPVGGAEEKIGDVAILRRFATLCGGAGCRIAIIPTASSLSDTGAATRSCFAASA